MSTIPQAQRSKFLAVIFLAIFLDMLGVTIIIPVLPALFEGEGAMFAHFGVQSRSILYGLLIGSYSIMQFIGAPVLGALSDRHGRKPILTLALIGAFVGYILFGVSVAIESIWLMFIARMIPGFMGGNIAVIYSAIADVSSDEEKARNFGLVGAAFGLGFIIGPGLGGVLADSEVVSWFNYGTPFWFTACLTFINIILVRLFFPETLQQSSTKEISLFQGLKNIGRVLQLPRLRSILLIVLLVGLGFTFFTQFYSVYLFREFDFEVRDVGILFLWVGIWLTFTQGFLVRVLSKRYKPAVLLRISIFFVGITILLIIFQRHVWQLYVVNALIAITFGITSPNLTALVSMEADDDQQGEVLGLNQSVTSLSHVIPPLIGGVLLGIETFYPLLAGGIVVLIAALVFNLMPRNNSDQ